MAPTKSYLETELENVHSLPNVEEARTNQQINVGGNNRYSGKNKRLIALIVVLVAVITTAVGLTIAATQNKKGRSEANSLNSENNNNDDEDGNADYTNNDDGETDDVERFEQVVAFLSDNEISSKANLLSSTTPQHKAANFMANIDEYDIPEEITDSEDDDSYIFIQRYVMAVFYYAMNGDGWTRSADFLKASADTCDWNFNLQLEEPLPGTDDLTDFDYGVSCYDDDADQYGDSVTYIFLPDNNLVGSIPTEIAWLPDLEHFSVFNNKISGSIPDAFSEFEYLEYWNMENNRVSGKLPSYLNQLNALQYLALGNNSITGTLPSFVDSNLVELSLDNNDLDGSIDALNDAVLLEVLYLNDNSFSSTLSSQTLSALENLSIIDLSLNQFKGSFPSRFYLVDEINLSNNDLMGVIDAPENMPVEGFPIYYLNLADNQLQGSIPTTFGLLQELITLDVSNNGLTGEIPAELGDLTQLQSLYLSNNDEFAPGPIPDLRECTDLFELSMASTNRNSYIHHWIGGLTSLQLLDLHDNALTSTIPTQLSELASLELLLLNHNLLENEVPTELGLLESLVTLYLDHNAGLLGDMSPICDGPAEDLTFITVDDNVDCDCCTDVCTLQTDTTCNVLSRNSVIRLEDSNTITRDTYVLSEDMILETAPLN